MTKRSFLADLYSLVSSQFAVSLLALGTSVIVARALGAEGRGHFALALLLPTVLTTFTDFGIGTTGPRFAAMRRWPLCDLLASHVAAGAVRVALTAVVGVALIATAADTFFPGVPRMYLFIGLLQLVPTTVAGFILTLLLGVGRAAIYSRLLLLSSLLSFIAIAVVWLTHGDVQVALELELVAGWVSAVVIWFVVLAVTGRVGAPNTEYLREAGKFGIGVYISNVTLLANARITWLLINAIAGAAALGIYTVAQAATERIYLLADAMGTLLLPKVAESPDQNSALVTPVVFRIAIAVSVGAAAVIGYFASFLVRFLFSAAFDAAVGPLRLLLIAVILSSGWRVLFQDLNARGKSIQTAMINGTASISGIVLAAVLLPSIGVLGAAWSAVGAAAISISLGVWSFHRYRGRTKGALSLITFTHREKQVLSAGWQRILRPLRGRAHC